MIVNPYKFQAITLKNEPRTKINVNICNEKVQLLGIKIDKAGLDLSQRESPIGLSFQKFMVKIVTLLPS